MTLADYRASVGTAKCKRCKTPLPKTIKHYPHEHGWAVEGLPGLQWLYIECSNPQCEHQWSLEKLGVPRG